MSEMTELPQADNTQDRSRKPAGPGRVLRRIGLVLALLLALAAGAALTSRWLAVRSTSSVTTATYHAPPPVELPLFRDGQHCGPPSVGCSPTDLFCPSMVAWSPNERQVAILIHCSLIHGAVNKVLVYDTVDGHLNTTIVLDDIVSRDPGIPNNCHGDPRGKALQPFSLLWLPSGRLAVVGIVYLWSAISFWVACLPWDALILVDANGAHPLIAHTSARLGTNDDYCGRTWDLQTATPAATSLSGDDCPLAPALGYRWGDDGALQPLTPLNSATVPSAPGPGSVGNPNGGAQFTIWQSATISRRWPTATGEPDATPSANLYELDATLGAFSPDGRYAYSVGLLFYRLEPAGQQPPSRDELKQVQADGWPLLPVKDAALKRVLAKLPLPAKSGTGFEILPTTLAWRPDGAVMATLGTDLDIYGRATDAQQPVQVLDCANGSVRLSLTPLADPKHTQAIGSSHILSWSPDGSHLLLISGARGTATLWNLSGLH